MKIQNLYAPHILEHHDPSRLETSQLIEKAGIVHYSGSRFYVLLPMGRRVFNSLQKIIRDSALKEGFQEISLPKIQPTRFLRETGRLDSYVASVYRLSLEFGDFCLSRTNEETINDLVRNNLFKRHLPLCLFQFGEVFSYNTPAGGLISNSEFDVFEAYSFHNRKDSAIEKVDSFKKIVKDLCNQSNLTLRYVESSDRNYGNFLLMTNKGQHRIFVCEGNHVTRYDKKRETCIVCGQNIRLQRGLGIAMFKVFNDFFARKLDVKFRDDSNEEVYPYLTTYGIGMSRLLYAIIEQNRDREGIVWPEKLSPFDVYLIPKNPSNQELLNRLVLLQEKMESAGMHVLVDDRKNARVNSKIKTSRFIGIPKTILITEHGLKVQNRRSFIQEESTLEQIIREYERN